MREEKWYHKRCGPSGFMMFSQTKNGVCEACKASGSLYLFVREGERRTPVVLLGDIREVDECTECKEIVSEIESMPQRKEEVRKEENVNETKTELEQLKARVAALERYFKENSTT